MSVMLALPERLRRRDKSPPLRAVYRVGRVQANRPSATPRTLLQPAPEAKVVRARSQQHTIFGARPGGPPCPVPSIREDHFMFALSKSKAAGLALAGLLVLTGGRAVALDQIRFGKAVPNSFAFGAADVGIQAKIFEQEGIDVSILSFAGDARMQQALTAGAIDISVGSGPGLGFRVKGVPAIGVAAMYGAPSNLTLTVLANSPIKRIADLKGKRVGVTTLGSLTDWLTRELSRQQGWGSDGIEVLPLGSVPARLAAMERGELDGLVIESATGFELEEQGKGRNLLLFGDIEKNFYTHVIYATDEMIQKKPDLLKRFLRGWFRTIAFMKANKDFTVKVESKTIEVRESVVAKVYDTQIGSFSTDGAWDPVSIDRIRNSLKDLGILDTIPEAKAIYNSQFVPVKF
jgi:NitT/TauT family transport system substrate-binding protein